MQQKGQIFILALVILGLVVTNTLVIISGSITSDQSSHYSSNRLAALNLAEAGVDKAIATLNGAAGSYTGESGTTFGSGQIDVGITTQDINTLLVVSTGYIPNKTKPIAQKTVKVKIAKGIGTAFPYAIQVGTGGLVMSAGSQITGVGGILGSVYSNGNISSTGNGASITGDAYVAGGVAATADVSLNCTSSCYTATFGLLGTNGVKAFDIAQSFRPTLTGYLRKVSLKLARHNKPPDVKVYLLGNNATGGDKPDKTQVLSSGILKASLAVADTQPGGPVFIDVGLNPAPSLTLNVKYWVMIETSTYAPDPNNYWVGQAFSSDTYANGEGKYSDNWQATTPVWTAFVETDGDLNIQTYMGGTTTSILGFSGSNKLTIGDGNCTNGKATAHANTIGNLNVEGDYFYKTISPAGSITTTCSGVGHTGANAPDPATTILPISEGNIAELEKAAVDAGTTTIPTDTSCATAFTLCKCPVQPLAKGKYIGSVDLSGVLNGCTVIFVSSPIWFTGHFYLGSKSTFKLDPSMGNQSGFMIVGDPAAPDPNKGKIDIGNTNIISGDGQPNSYFIMISNFDSTGGASDAIAAANNLTTSKVVLYSNKGNISVKNNNSITAIYGYRVNLGNNTIINYEQGLANVFLSTSPGGQYSFIKGTYQQQ